MFQTPILFIIFNRPEITQKVFNQIKQIQPMHLFIAADGPKTNRLEDLRKCEDTRNIINQINWPCELKTLFRDENRGCGYGPAEAVTWFFEQVEQGIILEDDCLPDPSFFFYCEQLLQKYMNDPTIYLVCGTNPMLKWKEKEFSYLFAKLGWTWGWATWRRAWNNFDYTASLWNTMEGKRRVEQFLSNEDYFNHFSQEFNQYFKTVRNDVWDFQWLLCRFYNSGYSIVPTRNLISNIGTGMDATHTGDIQITYMNLPVYSADFSLKSGNKDQLFDWYIFERFNNPTKRSFLKKIILKIVKMIFT